MYNEMVVKEDLDVGVALPVPISTGSNDDVVLQYLPKVRAIARRLKARIPDYSEIDLEDLVSSGFVGLLSALRRYDETRHVQLSTFVEFRIEGEMLDTLRQVDPVSRGARTLKKKVDAAIEVLEGRYDRAVTNVEIADYLDIGQDELEKVRLGARVQQVSLDSLDSDNNPTARNEFEFLATLRVSNDSVHDSVDLLRIVGVYFKELDKRDQFILEQYYGKGRTLKQIGTELEVTESRVSQLHGEAVKCIRNKVKAREFFHQAMGRLPDNLAAVVKGYYLEGKRRQELADTLGCSMTTITRYNRTAFLLLEEMFNDVGLKLPVSRSVHGGRICRLVSQDEPSLFLSTQTKQEYDVSSIVGRYRHRATTREERFFLYLIEEELPNELGFVAASVYLNGDTTKTVLENIGRRNQLSFSTRLRKAYNLLEKRFNQVSLEIPVQVPKQGKRAVLLFKYKDYCKGRKDYDISSILEGKTTFSKEEEFLFYLIRHELPNPLAYIIASVYICGDKTEDIVATMDCPRRTFYSRRTGAFDFLEKRFLDLGLELPLEKPTKGRNPRTIYGCQQSNYLDLDEYDPSKDLESVIHLVTTKETDFLFSVVRDMPAKLAFAFVGTYINGYSSSELSKQSGFTSLTISKWRRECYEFLEKRFDEEELNLPIERPALRKIPQLLFQYNSQ